MLSLVPAKNLTDKTTEEITKELENAEQSTDKDRAVIFDIQRFSIHDGPGIRTTVFFKGCSLRCTWCQNPESLKARPEMAFYRERCQSCGDCFKACPDGAIDLSADERIRWQQCSRCGKCADACSHNALRLIGQHYNAAELLSECLKDKDYFKSSTGGITLSGGEPVLYHHFLKQFLPQLQQQGIHILLQTAGNYPFSMLESFIDFVDEVYFDYKLPDDESYQAQTGVGAARIRDNLQRLAKHALPLTVRVPLIPGINTEPDQIANLCQRLQELDSHAVTLLHYNHFWEAKLPSLATTQRSLGIGRDDIDYAAVLDRFHAQGIDASYPH